MRSLDNATLNLLRGRRIVSHDFLWMSARDRTTGTIVYDGYWSDHGEKTIEVINPDTLIAENRTFYGSGTLLTIDNIPLVSNITVQSVEVRVSDLNDRVQTMLREYDPKQGIVEIYRAFFDPDTQLQIAPAVARFVGFIDRIEIKEPADGEEGSTIATCVSHTQEFNRSNPDTRSDESQKLRDATDNFYQNTAAVGEWEFFWGKASGSTT